jgi:S1-C subfamily serine protease
MMQQAVHGPEKRATVRFIASGSFEGERMRRPALYSSSRPARADQIPLTGAEAAPAPAAVAAPSSSPDSTAPARPRRRWLPTQMAMMWFAIVLLGAALVAAVALNPMQRRLTQDDINAAVLKTMETQVMPSEYARAYENIRPAVVRVVSYVKKSRLKDGDAKPVHTPRGSRSKPVAAEGDAQDDEVEAGVGTGVVIIDKGVILTNLHVVSGADRIKVIFYDGLESPATVTGAQPENDMAVLQAARIPDDLIAATMRSTSDLASGDKVLAVGFPFGIGPSASGGIVSGLGRAFKSPEGKQEMKNLIQFDAAANPGNSGGPLVTMDGEVVGIVTAILNPTSARTFLGIGFAVPIENAASAAGLPPF